MAPRFLRLTDRSDPAELVAVVIAVDTIATVYSAGDDGAQVLTRDGGSLAVAESLDAITAALGAVEVAS